MVNNNGIPIEVNKKPFETVYELKDEYKVPSFEEFMKTYEPSEKVEFLAEAEYQDRVSHGPKFGPGNEQSVAATVAAAGATVVGGVVIVVTGGVAAPAVAAVGTRVVQGAYEVYHVRNHLEARQLAFGLGLGTGAYTLVDAFRNFRDSSTSSSSTLERKTI